MYLFWKPAVFVLPNLIKCYVPRATAFISYNLLAGWSIFVSFITIIFSSRHIGLGLVCNHGSKIEGKEKPFIEGGSDSI